MKTAVLAFGNEYVKEDKLAKELVKELKIKDISFFDCEVFDDIFNYIDYDMVYILDVVKNLKETKLLSIRDLKTKSLYTMHDFDLAFNLKIMKKLGEIQDIKIIGIPIKGDKETIKNQIVQILS